MNASKDKIDELMERASDALVHTRYFEAERLALRALHAARKAGDFDRLARICLPLQEARRQRLMLAHDVKKTVRVIDRPYDPATDLQPGCVLFQPPLVAADARRYRIECLERDIPVAVLCREPLTQTRLQPLAALGAVVVRTKVRPPKRVDQPDREWFIDAMERLGDAAIDEIDPALVGVRRVDALLDRLDAVPDHEKLHQRLADAAHDALKHADTSDPAPTRADADDDDQAGDPDDEE